MTQHGIQTLAGSPSPETSNAGSLRTTATSSTWWPRCGRGLGNGRGQLLSGVVLKILVAVCVTASALSPTSPRLFAQPPGVESPEAPVDAGIPGDNAALNTPTVPSLPADSEFDFDIDLGTEEFENFGEEGFQVEEADYFRDTVLPTAIKVAIGAVVVLLLAWVAMKLLKSKRPSSGE